MWIAFRERLSCREFASNGEVTLAFAPGEVVLTTAAGTVHRRRLEETSAVTQKSMSSKSGRRTVCLLNPHTDGAVPPRWRSGRRQLRLVCFFV